VKCLLMLVIKQFYNLNPQKKVFDSYFIHDNITSDLLYSEHTVFRRSLIYKAYKKYKNLP
jgi:hypothetical protein